MQPNLNPRQHHILMALVREFIRSGEPVSSLSLSRDKRLKCSSATIRNVMGELHGMGLIAQLHSSSGRIPTTQGLRLFVDWVQGSRAEQSDDDGGAITLVEGALESDSLPQMAQLAASLLSEMTHLTSLASVSTIAQLRLSDIKLSQLVDKRLMVIVVTEDGQALHRAVPLDTEVSAIQLTRMQNYLAGIVVGATLASVREHIERERRHEVVRYRDDVRQALELGAQAFADLSPGELWVDGTFNLLDVDEFQTQPSRLRELLRALDDKELLLEVLERLCEVRETVVLIGPELDSALGDDVSLVACSYFQGDSQVGMLGLIGPTRMDYKRGIDLVERTARLLSEHLETSAS